ncbi:MAG TPA: transporter substrate-binding domain-containing protein [Acetobacteraceae bacterium]|nr:transporter substrate-binding domain-containing protein [Acetobacteraceae bacterium]
MRLLRLLPVFVCLVSGTGVAMAADPGSTWDHVMSTKKLVSCVVPSYQPYSWKDQDGSWQGFAVTMAKDVAKDLHVAPEFIESGFSTVVLDLQSGKCDDFFGFNATPERALAIDFAGPLYTLGFGALDRKGWKAPGDHWADLNDPSIRVCYSIGNSSEQQIKRFAPKSTQVALGSSNDCVLALMAGRVDRYIDGIMGSMGAMHKNPQLGPVHVMTPSYALPSYAGTRLDGDGRFQKFLQRWSEYNRANGNITQWLTDSVGSIGITAADIPPDVQF